MRRNRALALILLLLTVAPLAIWVVLIFSVPSTLGAPLPVDESEQIFREPFTQGIIWAGVITLGLMVFYLFHLYGTSRLPAGKRALWLVLIVFANIFAMPFYWYLHIWQNQRNGAA